MTKISERYDKKLLVEGNDDQHVVWALCEKFNIEESFDVIDCKSINNLLQQIPLRFKQSDIKSVGIIIDADTNIKSRWNSVSAIFSKEGFNFPDDIPEKGLIVSSSSNKKAGVWIMPDNNLNGMIEDFIKFLVPADDQLLPVVDKTLEDLESKKLNKYKPVHRPKAAIHSWLAWQKDPGTPLGLAITKKYLDTDEEICTKFVGWLNKLFNS